MGRQGEPSAQSYLGEWRKGVQGEGRGIGRWEAGLMSGRNLDFELWNAGLFRLCQWSALPSGQYWNVAGVP